MERSLIILLDGWDLAYTPNTPAAIHLWALLENIPTSCRVVLASPSSISISLPTEIELCQIDARATHAARLHWEQQTLSNLARRKSADLIHLLSGAPALFGNIPSVQSPAGFELSREFSGKSPEQQPPGREAGISARVRYALQTAGILRLRSLAWPADLTMPDPNSPTYSLPPIVPALFLENTRPDSIDFDLPESYILNHGPGREIDLQRALDAWSWAAPAIGEYYPLVFLGLDSTSRQRLERLAETYHLAETIRALPPLSMAEVSIVYQRCSALFQTGPISLWGDPLWLGLACAKPIVALQSPLSHDRLGSAAYLVQPGASLRDTSRTLGAALITVIVEDSVAATLSSAAKKRSAAWWTVEPNFKDAMGDFYRNAVGF